MNNNDSNLSMEEVLDQYYANLRKLLKEKLEDGHVKYYIDCTPSKLGSIAGLIKYWIQVNDENKFLMSITDEELENYVNNINTNGFAVSEKSMIGTWKMSSTDEVNQFIEECLKNAKVVLDAVGPFILGKDQEGLLTHGVATARNWIERVLENDIPKING